MEAVIAGRIQSGERKNSRVSSRRVDLIVSSRENDRNGPDEHSVFTESDPGIQRDHLSELSKSATRSQFQLFFAETKQCHESTLA